MNEPSDPSIPPRPESGPGPASGTGRGKGGRRLGLAAPLLVGALILAALATSYFFFSRGPRGQAPGKARANQAPRRTCVAVFPVLPAPGAEEVAWVGDAVYRFLPIALEDTLELRVITPERLHDLSKEDLPAALPAQQALARKGGADYFLRGEVSGKPGSASVQASWIEAATGREAEHWTVDGISAGNLGRKLDELHAQLRLALRLGPRESTEPPLLALVPIKEAPTRAYLSSASLLVKGDPAGCLKALEEALSLPDFHLAYFLQTEAAARAGDARTAVTAGSRLLKGSRSLPARVQLLTPAILAIYGSGNPRSAIAPLESFLARFPDEKYPLSWLGAIEVLLLQEPGRALDPLSRSLALDPANLDVQRLLGQADLETGRAAAAIPLLESVLKARPEDGGARFLLADALRRAGRAEDARRAAEEILARNPDEVRAVSLLGSLYLDQGKTREAGDLYARLSASPKPAAQAEGELLLGRNSFLQGKFQEGLRHYRAAADRAARAGDAVTQGRYLVVLAEAQSFLGRNPEALTTLSEIRGIEAGMDPDLSIITVTLAQKQFDMSRTLLDEQTRRWQGKIPPAALQRLRDSLEGTIALEQGNYTEALKKIRASFPDPKKEPPDSEILGRAYLGSGDAVRAEGVFRRITEDPDRFSEPVRFVRSLIWLGEAREKLGKKEEALESYREALRWWGSCDLAPPPVARAREGLKRLGG